MSVSFFLQLAAAALATLVPPGRLEQIGPLQSKGIAPRNVVVWLPPDFSRDRKYAVLYVHDGQMQFDASKTWNGKAWRIDSRAARLIDSRRVRDFIIVAIDNDPARRHAEFFPEAALERLTPAVKRNEFIDKAMGGRPAANDYLRFLVEVVKPAIDGRYPTDLSRESTFIMGSSMGGLISLYALCEYPQVFGGAAALSTHWIGSFERNAEIPAAINSYLRDHLPAASSVRLYMDRGTIGLESLYEEAQADVDRLMREKNFAAPYFRSLVIEGAGHDENAWAARVATPIEFLLAPRQSDAASRADAGR